MSDCRDLQPTKWQFFRLSNNAVSELRSILTENWPDDEDIVEDIMSTVDSGLIERGFPENLDETDPKKLKDRLLALRKSAQAYLDCENTLTVVERYWLADSVGPDSEVDEELKKYDNYGSYAGMYGSTCSEIRNGMNILIRAIDNVTENLAVSRGAKPNHRARWLAFEILECMENYGLKATTYDDGIYFNVLGVAFREALPALGSEAHRRHGEWAIKHGYNTYE